MCSYAAIARLGDDVGAASRSTGLVEYLTGSPLIDELSSMPWSLDADGMLPIPEQPGLAINLDLGAFERYTGVRQESI